MDTSFLNLLCKAPETQIDKSIILRLLLLPKSLTPRLEVQEIMDDCAKYSLTSDFALRSMEWLYETIESSEEYDPRYGVQKYRK